MLPVEQMLPAAVGNGGLVLRIRCSCHRHVFRIDTAVLMSKLMLFSLVFEVHM